MKFLLSLLALLLSSIGLFGQKQDMVSFSIDDGMQNGSVQSMVKGSDGYVYIGTFTPNRIRISLCRTAKRNPLIFPI
mgnify:FL=1